MKKIAVQKGEQEELAKIFSVSRASVWRALSYQSGSRVAQKIRTLALKKGGIRVDAGSTFETIHDANGRMIQTWGGGKVRLEVSKETGDAVWYVDGKERGKKPALSVSGLMALQQKLAVLYGSLS
ncbi:MAG: hypothetical protein SOW44_09030 [Porphyromonas sp.]|nr:hypothetical protein [Bacteroidales bacterium]MDY3101464.1 hypothetical protein [Porphyromonas sp.]